MPMMVARSVLIATAPSPSSIEMRAPWMTRLRMSRPKSSVPSGWLRLGACRRSLDLTLMGSYGASTGARRAVATRPRMSRPPSAPSGLPRMTRSRDMPGRLAEPDARVEEAVHHVDHQIQRDDAGGQEQVDALDDGVVPPGDGVEQELSHAGDDEDALHDDGPAEEGRELEAHHREHRDHRVLQHVAGDDQRLRQALGPRGADVVLAQHLEHH